MALAKSERIEVGKKPTKVGCPASRPRPDTEYRRHPSTVGSSPTGGPLAFPRENRPNPASKPLGLSAAAANPPEDEAVGKGELMRRGIEAGGYHTGVRLGDVRRLPIGPSLNNLEGETKIE